MYGAVSRGGIDLNTPGVGPVIAAIKSPFIGPNGAGVTGATSGARGGVMQTTGASYGGQGAAGGMPGSPIVVLIGLLGLAFLLWLARRNSSYLQQNVIGFNTYNVVTIGIIASVWIILAKVVFNKAVIPGVTPLVNAL